jgi:ubiquitin-protein ligase
MAMHPRDRRLQSEYEDMRELAKSSSLISFVSRGVPPVKYEITSRCLGLIQLAETIVRSDNHKFDLELGDSFPLVAPAVVWRTPIFHPNIKPPHVCAGNIWYPAMSVAEYCVELCRLIQFQSFNVYDPLNQEAGLWLWVSLNADSPGIPVDNRPIIDAVFEIDPVGRPAVEGKPDGNDD